MVTFDREQRNAFEEGKALRLQLQQITEEACNLSKDFNYRHYYITGTAGGGKSHSILQAAQKSGVAHYVVKGQSSLFGMAQSLALLKIQNWDNPVVIIVDDCDSLFKDEDSINTMKDMLGPNATFTYSKNFHLNTIPEGPKRDAIEAFMNMNNSGFEIPLNNFHFVFTSNIDLPTKNQVAEALERSKGVPSTRYHKMNHLLAIRSRVNYKTVTFDKAGMWGSIAYILLEDGGCPNLTDNEKMFILDWMWNKWDQMNETSVRTAEKMGEDLIKVGIENAKDRWTYNYID